MGNVHKLCFLCFLNSLTTAANRYTMTKQKTLFPFIFVTSLFFLWGFAHNLNPILIPHLKKACELSDFQSAFVDFAFYIAYFLIAIPAGLYMKRFGYKAGIIFGLLLFSLGAFLFIPAASTREYMLFLVALFVIASGLTFLETAANPYITVLGAPETATQRLNFAQSFNGLAATLAPFLGGQIILSGTVLSDEELAGMSSNALDAYLQSEANSVIVPYLVIGAVVLLMAIILRRTKLPEIVEEQDEQTTMRNNKSLFHNKNFVFGVITLFCYVGAQVGVLSFFIRFSAHVADVPERAAANLLAIALLGFMLGRFVGTGLMRFVTPARLLVVFSLMNIVFTIIAVSVDAMLAIYALMGVTFFMSIMFPTIFALSISGLGSQTKQGSSVLIMSIVGGALIPVLMGQVSDMTNMQIAYLVPGMCFAVVLVFAVANVRNSQISNVGGGH